MYMCSRRLPTIITSLLHARRAVACEENPSEMVLHFCTFLLNPHFDLEPDYIFRKPIKQHFQWYIVHTEIFSTFHAQVEYISDQNTWFRPLLYNLALRTSLLLRATTPKHRMDMVLHFCTFLLNPHFDLEPDCIIRKPMKRHFQWYVIRTEIFSTFHTEIQYVIPPIHTNGTECAHTHTHKSENIISASFTPFTWRI